MISWTDKLMFIPITQTFAKELVYRTKETILVKFCNLGKVFDFWQIASLTLGTTFTCVFLITNDEINDSYN